MKYKYIHLFDNNTTSGLRVNLSDLGSEVGSPKTKRFKYTDYKSSDLALKAAIKWRDARLDECGLSHLLSTNKNHTHQKRPHLGNSGVSGVSLQQRKNISGTKYFWRASFRDEEGYQNIFYSVSDLGECEAFRCACRARYEYAGFLIIGKKNKIPCKPDVPFELV